MDSIVSCHTNNCNYNQPTYNLLSQIVLNTNSGDPQQVTPQADPPSFGHLHLPSNETNKNDVPASANKFATNPGFLKLLTKQVGKEMKKT